MTPIQWPSTNDLIRLYYELSQHGARTIGKKVKWNLKYESLEELLMRAAELSRFDPRLFEALVQWVYDDHETFNLIDLRKQLKQSHSPQTLLTVFHFAESSATHHELKHIYEYLSQDFSPAPIQLYFYNLYKPASSLLQKALQEPIQEFLDWGYLARTRPTLRANGIQTLGTWSPNGRANILKQFANKQKQFSLSDYLNKLDHSISRQQALIDLKGAKFLKSKGKGRGSIWELADDRL